MRARCVDHGIALGDDGTCVLCRRTSVQPKRAERTPWSSLSGVALLGFIATIFAAVLMTIKVLTPTHERPPEPVIEAQASTEASPTPTGEPARATVTAPAQNPSSPWASDGTPLRESDQAAKARTAAQQQAEFEAWAHREATREMDEQDTRSRRLRGDPNSAAAGTSKIDDDALRRVPITMYSTQWCGVCKAARTFMTSERIPFTERDVDTDPVANAEARRLNPRSTVPTFDVAGTTLIGFRPQTLVAAIRNAASRE